MNSGINCDAGQPLCDSGGWLHVMDINKTNNYVCNGPYPGTNGPLLRYSRLDSKTVLITYPNGKRVIVNPITVKSLI